MLDFYHKIQLIIINSKYCHSNGYCCASCPGNEMPFGTCIYSHLKSFYERQMDLYGTAQFKNAYCPRGCEISKYHIIYEN